MGHRVQEVRHLLGSHVVGTVRGGVEQPEGRMGGGAQPRLRCVGEQLGQDGHPLLDVETLQAADAPAVGLGDVAEFAVLHGDERGLAEGEADVPAQQGVQRGCGVGRGDGPAAALVQELLADPQQHLRQHGRLAGEVPVEPGAGDAGRGADVVDGHAVEAAAGEQSRRGVEDLIAPRAAGWPSRAAKGGLAAAGHAHMVDGCG